MRIRVCIFRRYDPREENGSGSICDYDEWLLLRAMSSGCVFHGLFLAQTPLPALQNWRESVVHGQLQFIGQLFLSLSVAGRRVKSKAVAVPILGSICGSSKGFCSCAHNWFLSSPRPGRKRHVNFVTNPSLATAIHPL
jgi:hypothetical protein